MGLFECRSRRRRVNIYLAQGYMQCSMLVSVWEWGLLLASQIMAVAE